MTLSPIGWTTTEQDGMQLELSCGTYSIHQRLGGGFVYSSDSFDGDTETLEKARLACESHAMKQLYNLAEQLRGEQKTLFQLVCDRRKREREEVEKVA